jgi:UDP-3-O-[3-hydroxymyristoyl] glucosamine N-acyltransferase
VRRGTKVDSCCHIAHNDDIGEDVLVAAHTMFSGSVTIGDRTWVGPATVFRDALSVGEESFVAIGSLVVRDLPPGSRVMGAPARPFGKPRTIPRESPDPAADDDTPPSAEHP